MALAVAAPLIRFLAFLAGATNFVFAAGLLVVIVRAKELGAGEAAIGTIFSIGSLGGLLGAVLARRVQAALGMAPVILLSTWVQVLLFPLYAIAPNVVVMGVLTGVLFFVLPIFNVVVISYRLSQVPDVLQGRVNSAARMIVFLFQPLGSDSRRAGARTFWRRLDHRRLHPRAPRDGPAHDAQPRPTPRGYHQRRQRRLRR